MIKSIEIKFDFGGTFYIENCLHINITLDIVKIVAILDGTVVERTIRLNDIKDMKIKVKGNKRK